MLYLLFSEDIIALLRLKRSLNAHDSSRETKARKSIKREREIYYKELAYTIMEADQCPGP